jgi:hypothetical protein
MSDSASAAAAKPANNRAAVIAAPVAAVVLYVIVVTLVLIALSRAMGGIASDNFGGAALLWAIYLLPAIVTPAASARRARPPRGLLAEPGADPRLHRRRGGLAPDRRRHLELRAGGRAARERAPGLPAADENRARARQALARVLDGARRLC